MESGHAAVSATYLGNGVILNSQVSYSLGILCVSNGTTTAATTTDTVAYINSNISSWQWREEDHQQWIYHFLQLINKTMLKSCYG